MLLFVSVCRVFVLCDVFFFKQKTAYEMRISDWSSDVCSSDLRYGADGRPSGEVRFVGLFTAEAYDQPASAVPLIREKVANVLTRAHMAREIGRASCRERVCQYV